MTVALVPTFTLCTLFGVNEFADRDMDSGYTLSVGRGQPVAAAAAAAASDGMVLPTVFEQAAAGVGVGGLGSGVAQLCIIRDGEAARMGGCEEQTRLTLQVRDAEHVPTHS